MSDPHGQYPPVSMHRVTLTGRKLGCRLGLHYWGLRMVFWGGAWWRQSVCLKCGKETWSK